MQRFFAFLIAAAASIGIAFANPVSTAPLAGEKLAQKEATPAKDAKKPAAAPAKDAKADAKKEPMDINSASEKDLATLTGIGEARAKAIVKGRPYKGKDDLVNKKILTQKVYDEIKDQIIAKQATAEKKTAEKKK
jgi:competence protein ComEA